MLSKTLTFGLGTLSGFDKRSEQFIELADDQRKKIYGAIIQSFRDFARLCNFTTSLLYTSRTLKVDLESLGFNTGYKPIEEKLGLKSPLAGDVKSQAWGLAKAHFAGEHGKKLMRSGESVLPPTDLMGPILYASIKRPSSFTKATDPTTLSITSFPTLGRKRKTFCPG